MKIVYPNNKPLDGNNRAIVSVLLSPAALIYRLGSTALRKMSQPRGRSEEMGTVVVSVGNVESGGGGKTPFCIFLLEHLVLEGYRPVYISRGFRSSSEKLAAVSVLLPEELLVCPPLEPGVRFLRRDGGLLHRSVGDEGAMVALRVPLIPLLFSRRKTAAIRAAGSLFKTTHVILDDAFQSWGVRRDFDVVLLDSKKPFGNGRRLPAGSLREGPEALRRADFIGFNDIKDTHELTALEKSIKKPEAAARVFGIRRSLSFRSPEGGVLEPGENPMAALSSIARPGRFDQSLEHSGWDVRLSIRYPDHYRYTQRDVENIRSLMRKNGVGGLITTEKDWVKLKELYLDVGMIVLARLDLEIVGCNLLDQIKKPQATPAASL